MKKNIFFKLSPFLFLLSCISLNSSSYELNSTFNSRKPQTVSNQLGVSIIDDASVFKNIYALSDVHGMYQRAIAILTAGKVIDQNQKWSAANSLLIIDGDSIDKGPQSLEVLNLWIRLQSEARQSGGDLIHVLGNHEAEFLADPSGDKKAKELMDELAAQNVSVTDLTLTNSPRGIFLHNEPVAAKIGHWLFCHSGFYPDMSWDNFTATAQQAIQSKNYASSFLIGDNSILEAKDWEKNSSILKSVLNRLDGLGIYGVVFGHQPGAFGIKGRSAAKANGRMIKIDNGLPPEGGLHSGSLLVFTNPAQMNTNIYPQIKIIQPDQTSYDLIPE